MELAWYSLPQIVHPSGAWASEVSDRVLWQGMGESVNRSKAVTDSEIEAIIAQGEAGINDLINAYEPMERAYLQTVEASGGGEEAMPVVSSTGALEER